MNFGYTCSWDSSTTHEIKFGGLATEYNTEAAMSAIQFGYFTAISVSENCAKIASISGSLGKIFPTLNNGSNDLSKQPRFNSTFYGCSALTSIPVNLFEGIHGSADGMFAVTFQGCTSLATIPVDSN